MNTFSHAVIPCLIGAGSVLCGLHGFRAIWGNPKTISGSRPADGLSLEHSKLYYRWPLSLFPTLLKLFGFLIGSALAACSYPPLERSGYGWISPVLAGLSAGLGVALGLKLEASLILKFRKLHGWIDRRS